MTWTRTRSKTESFHGQVWFNGKQHIIQVIGFLWADLIDDKFPSMFDVWIDRVGHFHVSSTAEGWMPYERERMKVKQEWVDLAGDFIQAWYQ